MPSLSRSTLTTRIREAIDDVNSQRWTDTQIQQRIQEAQERFVLDTRALLASATTNVVAGTSGYSLPSDILFDVRAAYNGVKLMRTSKFDLDILYGSDWTAVTAYTPYRYYINLTPTVQTINLFPIPSQSLTSGLVLEYVPIPVTLANDSDTPFNSSTLLTPYHNALVYFVARELLNINPTQDTVYKAGQFDKQYHEIVSDCIETFKGLQDQGPMRMRGGRYFKGI